MRPTVEELVDHWRERDERYQMRRAGLTPDEESAVFAWRGLEIAQFTGRDRSIAETALSRWTPPTVRRVV
jgi:hypothetical protein